MTYPCHICISRFELRGCRTVVSNLPLSRSASFKLNFGSSIFPSSMILIYRFDYAAFE